MTVIIWMAVALTVMLALTEITTAVVRQMRREARLASRLRAIRHSGSLALEAGDETGAGVGLAGIVSALGLLIARSGLLSRKTVEGLQQTLSAAGFRGANALGLFVGTKLLLVVALPLIALAALPHLHVSPMIRNIGIAVAAVIGLLGPDWWVGQRHKKYLKAVQQGLPDALDMMVICAEAGLGFEPALSRVGREIQHAHPAIAEEFGQTASELRVVADSRIALANMGTRTGLDSLKRMASMLTQTMQYGTPLSDALRVLSAEMRYEMMVRYEARAARLPVLLTLPMIVFILPCIFLIVGGPAMIQVLNSMKH